MQIGRTWQSYNIGKVYVRSILPSTRTSIDIGQISKVIKELCHKNNFVFIDHENITSNDLYEKSRESYISQRFCWKGKQIFLSKF